MIFDFDLYKSCFIYLCIFFVFVSSLQLGRGGVLDPLEFCLYLPPSLACWHTLEFFR